MTWDHACVSLPDSDRIQVALQNAYYELNKRGNSYIKGETEQHILRCALPIYEDNVEEVKVAKIVSHFCDAFGRLYYKCTYIGNLRAITITHEQFPSPELIDSYWADYSLEDLPLEIKKWRKASRTTFEVPGIRFAGQQRKTKKRRIL